MTPCNSCVLVSNHITAGLIENLFRSLDEVNLALLSVGHLPVVRQRTQLFLVNVWDFGGGFRGRLRGLFSLGGGLSGSRGQDGCFSGNFPGGIGALVLMFTGLCRNTHTQLYSLCTHADLDAQCARHAWWVRGKPLQSYEPPQEREKDRDGLWGQQAWGENNTGMSVTEKKWKDRDSCGQRLSQKYQGRSSEWQKKLMATSARAENVMQRRNITLFNPSIFLLARIETVTEMFNQKARSD